MEEKQSEQVLKFESAFNGALHTLERINELINHIIAYRVNNHIIGFKENLAELLNETQGIFNKQEFKKAWADWEKIEKYEIIIDDDGNISYDPELYIKLLKFSSWIRLRLQRHKVTWASKDEIQKGVTYLQKKYGLK